MKVFFDEKGAPLRMPPTTALPLAKYSKLLLMANKKAERLHRQKMMMTGTIVPLSNGSTVMKLFRSALSQNTDISDRQ